MRESRLKTSNGNCPHGLSSSPIALCPCRPARHCPLHLSGCAGSRPSIWLIPNLRTRLLAKSPELGRVVPEIQVTFIREIMVRSYRIVYRIDEAQSLVEVIRFWHSARGIPEIDM